MEIKQLSGQYFVSGLDQNGKEYKKIEYADDFYHCRDPLTPVDASMGVLGLCSQIFYSSVC